MKDKALFNDDCRRVFNNKQSAYHLWRQNSSQFFWADNYVALKADAARTYDQAKDAYSSHIQEVLTETTQPHKWWASIKSFFGTDSSMPPLLDSDDSISCGLWSIKKGDFTLENLYE